MSDLDSVQKQAVNIKEGPALVCAGPGSGKTKTLTCRILNLLKNEVSPKSILAITFTNKAAGEMKERIKQLIDEDRQKKAYDLDPRAFNLQFIGTIHALCLEILKEENKAPLVIIDDQDRLEIIKRLRTKHKFKLPTKEISRSLNNFKCNKIKKLSPELEDFLEIYDKELRNNKSLDYDDLLLEVLRLLKQDQKIQNKYQQRFKYILVDEYQDINSIQNEIIKTLARPQNNLFVIGDADQSIYSFRGAKVELFLRFEDEFPDAKILKLKKNYRSTPSIVKASLSLIQHNKKRLPLDLFCVNKIDSPVHIVKCGNERDEAKFIVSKIEKIIGGTALLHIDSGILEENEDQEEYQFSDFAVLYRKNSFAKYLEQEFLHKGIPYQVIGTNNLWLSQEIRKIMSLLKHLVAGNSNLGKEMQKEVLNPDRLEELKSKNIQDIIERSGVKNDYKDNQQALENLGRFEDIVAELEYSSIRALLAKLALLSRETYIDKRANCVKLMTIHQAKGLEFYTVFISGVEEGFVPLVKEEYGKDELEEERRLFYVGMTRAKKQLYLTYTKSRLIWGRRKQQAPSRFLKEIDREIIDTKEFTPRRKKKDQMKLL